MVALVIFWSSFFCLIFFLLGGIFKGLASAFNALLSSIGLVLTIAFFSGAVAFVLWLLYDIIDGIITSGFLAVLGTIIIFVIVVGLIIGLVGSFGVVLLELAAVIGIYILTAVSFVLEGAASLCEKAYGHFLFVITNRLEKC